MKKTIPLTKEDKERIKDDIKKFFTNEDIKANNFYYKNVEKEKANDVR